ncbi:MAG TPA: SDR family NAD(P)-dependent oxidoreductase [Isosphaeraceae bacterium]|nr:SDR family NAD(P)-dependent oxidoreductase [Isosphaeraceae bacterium]
MDYVAARGQVDYLFCNAGVGFRQLYCDIMKREDWNTVFDVNVFGVVNCVHHMLPHLVKQEHGHIVIVSSVAGITPLPYQSIYVASKHAVYGSPGR